MMITFNRPISFRHAGALVCAAMLASAVFTACDKKSFAPDPVVDEPTAAVSEKPMAFQTTSVRTKADGDAATTALPEGSSFGVFAYYQEGVIGEYTGTWADQATKKWTSAFMFNQKVTYSGGDSAVGTNYPYTPMKYWPYNEENTISFWAYYPYDANVAVFESAAEDADEFTSASKTGIPAVKFKVPDDAKTDFMTADLKKDEARPGTTTNSPVNLLFHHRLASVRFKAKTDLDYSAGDFETSPITFKITKIEVLNDYLTGTLSQTPGTAAVDAIAWSGITTESTVAHEAFSGEKAVAVEAVDCGEALYLLPQPVDHGDGNKKVTVNVTFTASFSNDHSVTKTVSAELDKAMTAATEDTPAAAIPQWDPNKQYVYTIVLSYEGIWFIVEVDEIVEYYYGMEGYDDYKVVL